MIGMIKRLTFFLFFCLGGFLFYIPYWIIFGTAAGRERRRLLKVQRQTNNLLQTKARHDAIAPLTGNIGPSPDGLQWWNGASWVLAVSPDGKYRWDGYEWTPIATSLPA
jgi:hypothetical protein